MASAPSSGRRLAGFSSRSSSIGWVFVADALRSSGRRSSSSSCAAARASRRRGSGSTLSEIVAGFRALGTERDARVIVFLYFCQTVVAGALRVLIVVTALDLLDSGTRAWACSTRRSGSAA